MDVSEEIFNDMKTKFDNSIKEIFLRKNSNSQMLTKEAYFQTIQKVKISKAKTSSKLPEEYQRLRRFDIINLDGIERLIVPVKEDNPVIKYFVHVEEMFQIIYEVHMACGHCGRNRMERELNSKYKNITREMVRTFLFLCYICVQKRPAPQSSEKDKVELSSFEVRYPKCKVNVLDMEANPDGPYRYILVYEDHKTKFVQFRPMKTCRIDEIVGVLLKIFTIFGAPSVIHSDNGRKFATDVVQELANRWSEIKMVHGQSQASTLNHEVMELLEMWLEKNRINKWSKCLRYVQLLKNRCHHKALNSTPYEAMFGTKCRVGIVDLPSNQLADISSEEELELLATREDGILNIKAEAETYINEGSMDFMENYLLSLKRENDNEHENEDSLNTNTTVPPPSKIIKLEDNPNI